jgi:hypothetical protein
MAYRMWLSASWLLRRRRGLTPALGSARTSTTSRVSISLRYIEKSQSEWAREIPRHPHHALYAKDVDSNLYLTPLPSRTRAEFDAADGSELRGNDKRPPKMAALLSSSALAVNFFDPLRNRALAGLGTALGLASEVVDVRFEYVCSGYPVGPRAPNLDVLIALADGRRVAVESKFSEPFRTSEKDALSDKYFANEQYHWRVAGLPRAQAMAARLSGAWSYLDAGQLLKHMLGLSNDGCATELLYLWYDTGLDDAVGHREELGRFAAGVAGDKIELRARTYQDVFHALQQSGGAPPAWMEYMGTRYFAKRGV